MINIPCKLLRTLFFHTPSVFPSQMEKVRTSPDNHIVYPYNKPRAFGEGIVLQNKQNSNKGFVKKGKTVNKTYQEERECLNPPWSPFKANKEERAESPRKACFKVHIVKNSR